MHSSHKTSQDFSLPETILVIEDAFPILNYIKITLQDHYSVLTFPSVEKALPSLDLAALILSDFLMPGLGGRGLIEHFQQTRARPLLIMSSLNPEAPELEIVRKLSIPILGKPFSEDQLLHAVRTALQCSNE